MMEPKFWCGVFFHAKKKQAVVASRKTSEPKKMVPLESTEHVTVWRLNSGEASCARCKSENSRRKECVEQRRW